MKILLSSLCLFSFNLLADPGLSRDLDLYNESNSFVRVNGISKGDLDQQELVMTAFEFIKPLNNINMRSDRELLNLDRVKLMKKINTLFDSLTEEQKLAYLLEDLHLITAKTVNKRDKNAAQSYVDFKVKQSTLTQLFTQKLIDNLEIRDPEVKLSDIQRSKFAAAKEGAEKMASILDKLRSSIKALQAGDDAPLNENLNENDDLFQNPAFDQVGRLKDAVLTLKDQYTIGREAMRPAPSKTTLAQMDLLLECSKEIGSQFVQEYQILKNQLKKLFKDRRDNSINSEERSARPLREENNFEERAGKRSTGR